MQVWFRSCSFLNGWFVGSMLMVSTPFKNISQTGSFPQVGWTEKHNWNHHPFVFVPFQACYCRLLKHIWHIYFHLTYMNTLFQSVMQIFRHVTGRKETSSCKVSMVSKFWDAEVNGRSAWKACNTAAVRICCDSWDTLLEWYIDICSSLSLSLLIF